MNISKAVITAAAPNQRTLPVQTLVDRDGQTKSVLRVLVEEARSAGIEQLCVVVSPGDETAYRDAVGESDGFTFVTQPQPLGYGHAIFCARDFVGGEPFLHMIGDHVYLSTAATSCARQVVEAAQAHDCAVSGVQPTRETQLPLFGTVGGSRVKGSKHLYSVERVAEKPTPTEAEQSLLVPGLRAGHYLCFFGIHVLTPAVMEILERHVATNTTGRVQLSPVLGELAQREKYLALEAQGRRYPLDVRYGLLSAQLALALSGRDRNEVLSGLCELLAQRELLSPQTETSTRETA
jgi:UTP--glucose-1-phosphate uridylyltransferase